MSCIPCYSEAGYLILSEGEMHNSQPNTEIRKPRKEWDFSDQLIFSKTNVKYPRNETPSLLTTSVNSSLLMKSNVRLNTSE